MKKYLFIIGLVVSVLSCNNKDKFEQEFGECLTKKQIELILIINAEFDNFVLNKFPKDRKNLKSAYLFMTNSIMTKGDYFDYKYSDKKLDEIRNKLIESGLFNNLNNVESFRIDNTNGDYLKCLETVSSRNEESNKILEGINASGGRYNMSQGIYKLGQIQKNGRTNSISKILLVFEFIMVEIEQKTTANKELS